MREDTDRPGSENARSWLGRIIAGHLDNQSQRELYLSRRTGFAGREPCVRDSPKGGTARYIARLPEVRMIKNIEELGAELQRIVSPNFVFLVIEKSVLLKAGPITTFRPRLPKRAYGRKHGSVKPGINAAENIDGPFTSGRQCAGHAVHRAVRRHNVYRVAALRLYDGGELPAFDQPVAVKRQFV